MKKEKNKQELVRIVEKDQIGMMKIEYNYNQMKTKIPQILESKFI